MIEAKTVSSADCTSALDRSAKLDLAAQRPRVNLYTLVQRSASELADLCGNDSLKHASSTLNESRENTGIFYKSSQDVGFKQVHLVTRIKVVRKG